MARRSGLWRGMMSGGERKSVRAMNARAKRRALADVRLLIPFEPKTFYAAGVNYEEHVREAAALLGT